DFLFEILADENVDAEMIKIPPMIIQPYVENAVKHGLLHKKGNRALSIRFTRTPDLLVVSVDDNGVGRKRAAELSHIKNAHHRSFSSGANQKRLEILNQGKSPTMGIRIIDKLTDKGAPLGTLVEISIPIV